MHLIELLPRRVLVTPQILDPPLRGFQRLSIVLDLLLLLGLATDEPLHVTEARVVSLDLPDESISLCAVAHDCRLCPYS